VGYAVFYVWLSSPLVKECIVPGKATKDLFMS
jgi:hypothetical protein